MKLDLTCGEELLGVLRSRETDFPWVTCDFEPTPAFERFRPMFDEELRLLDADQMDEWQPAYDRITGSGLRLFDTGDNQNIEDFLLHIRGDVAWFRF